MGFGGNGVLPVWMPLSVLTWIVAMAVFHGFGFAFEYCDRTGLFGAAKIRRADRLPYSKLLPRVIFNQVFVLLPCMIALQWAGLAFTGPAHLGWLRIGVSIVVMAVGHDVVQYVTHRYLLHDPRLMRTLGHAVHHTTGASKAISACYMSAPDFFLEIVLPYLLPLVLVGGGGSDIFFQLIVAAAGAFGGLYEHSGYDFAVPLRETRVFKAVPGLGRIVAAAVTSHAHGEHHRRFNVSFSDGFGSPGLCDTALATRWDMVEDSRPPRPRQAVPQKGSTTV